jgi:hypothetical protein
MNTTTAPASAKGSTATATDRALYELGFAPDSTAPEQLLAHCSRLKRSLISKGNIWKTRGVNADGG